MAVTRFDGKIKIFAETETDAWLYKRACGHFGCDLLIPRLLTGQWVCVVARVSNVQGTDGAVPCQS
jgi:hypothetical protein